jgi:hypothetical protein
MLVKKTELLASPRALLAPQRRNSSLANRRPLA